MSFVCIYIRVSGSIYVHLPIKNRAMYSTDAMTPQVIPYQQC